MQRHNLGYILENDYLLFAIHANIEEYKLAFLINKHLKYHLKRKSSDLDFYKKEGHITFSIYEFHNPTQEDVIYLINNITKSFEESLTSAGSLFENSSEEKTHYLIPEYKQTEYFIKIITDFPDYYERKFLKQITKIPNISTAYLVDQNTIKNKNNLNFD